MICKKVCYLTLLKDIGKYSIEYKLYNLNPVNKSQYLNMLLEIFSKLWRPETFGKTKTSDV